METRPHGSEGILYVVATPIGNLSDLTFRALEVLKAADWVACEDTRRTLRLLNHYGLRKRLVSLFGPREKKTSERVLEILAQGNSVALLTDAGTPAVSDPGNYLVHEAGNRGIRVEPVPGASAVACAASVSGLAENGFIFLGFLPRKKSKIKKLFKEALAIDRAVIFFESPFRVLGTLETAAEIFGEGARCFVGREMTKKFEEYLRGSIPGVAQRLKEKEILGEFTVILKP